MSRALREMFSTYATRWPDEGDVAARFIAFVDTHADCLHRTCVPGHLTGSALVTSPGLDQVLLTHHRKLGLWVQLGGHADGEANLAHVAMTEAKEESGRRSLHFLAHSCVGGTNPGDGSVKASTDPMPFDLDIHEIPANARDPAHLHYDVRYLIVAADPHGETVVVSPESHDVRWFTLAEARALTSEVSMHRQFDKLEALRRPT